MSRDIRKIVTEVNESLTDSQELTSTQRNALMLVHLINTMDDSTAKIESIVKSIGELEHLVDDHKIMYDRLEQRVRVLENNSLMHILNSFFSFLKSEPKLAVGVLVIIFTALGVAPEIVKIFAAYIGLEVP